MLRGLELMAENPILGVGLGGFPITGPFLRLNPGFFITGLTT